MRKRHPLLAAPIAAVAGALLLLLGSGAAVRASVPGQVNFQGLLLDSGGQPLTGSVDLDFALFPTDTGGSAQWSESHGGVAVQDGVYQVSLGETAPLTPALLTSGSLYLEITVEGETLAPRQRLLAVPYALRADTAENAESLHGLAGGFVTATFEHFEFDGGEPPNTDPREGLADPDGDTVPNFLDSDNDDDGLADTAELAQGSDINLVTPIVTGFTPTSADGFLVTSVEVQGQNFSAGLDVAFGGQNPTPSNITATSFDVDVGPQPEGTVSVVVTLANGESDSSSFPFFFLQPVITGFSPPQALNTATTTVTVEGQDFQPPLSVVFGSETPTATNVTSTSFEVDVGPQPVGFVDVSVTNGNGKVANAPSGFLFAGATELTVFVTSATSGGNLGGLAGADATCNALAAGAGLAGSYLAWLADSSESPATRFRTDAGPYRMPDGTIVAITWSDLTDGTLLAPIDHDEHGNLVGAAAKAWTNVETTGVAAGANHCTDWTATSGAGGRGDHTATGSGWTVFGSIICNNPQRLYCFED